MLTHLSRTLPDLCNAIRSLPSALRYRRCEREGEGEGSSSSDAQHDAGVTLSAPTRAITDNDLIVTHYPITPRDLNQKKEVKYPLGGHGKVPKRKYRVPGRPYSAAGICNYPLHYGGKTFNWVAEVEAVSWSGRCFSHHPSSTPSFHS